MMLEEFVLSEKYNVLIVVITTVWIISMFTIGWIGGIVGFIILCIMTGHRESLINKKAIEERQQTELQQTELQEVEMENEKETLESIYNEGQVLIEQIRKIVNDSAKIYKQAFDYQSRYKRHEILTPLKVGLAKVISDLQGMKKQYQKIDYTLITTPTDDEELLLLSAKFGHDLREIKQLLDRAEDLLYSIQEIGA